MSGATSIFDGPGLEQGQQPFDLPGNNALAPGSSDGLPDDFYARLQPATWRGATFYVLGSRFRASRRWAVHEYPFRDGAYAEDMARRGRVYGFNAFLVGDDVAQQVLAFADLVDGKGGTGELVHPSFGSLQVKALEFEAAEQWDEGRVWRFRAEFLEELRRGLVLEPGSDEDTGSSVFDAAGKADDATVQAADAKPAAADAKAGAAAAPAGGGDFLSSPAAPQAGSQTAAEYQSLKLDAAYKASAAAYGDAGQTPLSVSDYQAVHAPDWVAS